jgi:hypothetical protein
MLDDAHIPFYASPRIRDRWIMTVLALTLARTKSHLARSRELRSSLLTVVAETRRLIAQSRRLCRLRRIAGGSDADTPLIIDAIGRTPMCVECLTRKTGVAAARITDALDRVGRSIVVTASMARCEACLRLTRVYGVNGAVGAAAATLVSPRPAGLTQNEAVWQFLETHRGEMFCTQCIALALSATKRIDRAVIGAEGRGARRQHGRCSRCGKDRLLCGLAR